ncbi:MAG: metallophosphoesterase family protein [Gemmatimonadales bacterium]
MRRFTPCSVLLVLASVPASTGCRDRGLTTAATVAEAKQSPAATPLPRALPNKPGSFKFGVLGDFGTGDRSQYEMAAQMAGLHRRFRYDVVVLVGDNLYGSERPQDFRKKFELPYKPLLDAGVKFYASLGNHDAREQRFYKLFNMDGRLYYTFTPRADIRFFALESTYPEPEQIRWLEKALAASSSDWKIAFFHHPLYSSGDRHGSDLRLREVLEPLFLKHNVSVVLTGHDHFYERVKPQKGIAYFVVGSGGKLRKGNIDRGSGLTAKGFDTDLAFMAAEITGDTMYFKAVSRVGQTVDSGVIARRKTTR